MTNEIFNQVFTQTTDNAIEQLESLEQITLNEWQREAVRLLVQDERRVVELVTPRRAGKSFLIRKLVSRLGNSTHVVVANPRMRQMLIETGDIPHNCIHTYGNLVTLLETEPAPEILLCDECLPDHFLSNLSTVRKVLSLYTYPMAGVDSVSPATAGVRDENMESVTFEDLDRWRMEWPEEQIEKEWDDESN